MQAAFPTRAFDYKQRGSRYSMPQPGMDSEQPKPPKKPKFDQDFIILSEFSEQVGPVSLKIIPSDGANGEFDTSRFSVRIMSSDYSNTTGKFSISEDTQVILSQKQDGAFAYVHYFCLHDIFARGYVRQYCLSYISSSLSKIVDNFNELLRHFSEVTTMLKCANRKLFGKDLERQLADLQHTLELIEREGWTASEEIDVSQLYQGFDFASQDVPERDPTVVQHSLQETRNMFDVMQKELTTPQHAKACQEIHRRRQVLRMERQQQTQRANILLAESPPPPIRRESGFVSYVSSGGHADEQSLSDISTCSSDLSHYEPQRVMAHIVHKFERRLRQLEELAPSVYKIAQQSLLDIHKGFSRSEQALEVEKVETLLLDPRSSLLTIGRVPVLNMLQTYNRPSHTSFLLQTAPHTISCRNTWGQPCEFPDGRAVLEDGSVALECEKCSGFDTTFLEEKSLLNRCPLYLDTSLRTSSIVCQPSEYSLAMSIEYSQSTVDFDHTLTRSLKPLDASDVINTNAATLLPHEEETISHCSSTYNTPQTFATPKTGMTPTSSNGEEDEKNERDTSESVWPHVTGGDDVIVTGGDDVIVTGGDDVIVTGGDDVIVTGGDDVIMTGGDDVVVAAAPTVVKSEGGTELPSVMVWSSEDGEGGNCVKATEEDNVNSDDFANEETIGFLADSNPNMKSVEIASPSKDDPISPAIHSLQSDKEPPTQSLLNPTSSSAAATNPEADDVIRTGSKESTPETKRKNSPKLDPRRLLRNSKSPTVSRKHSKDKEFDRSASINNDTLHSIVSFNQGSWEVWSKVSQVDPSVGGKETEALKQATDVRSNGAINGTGNSENSREELLAAGSGQYRLTGNQNSHGNLRTQQQQQQLTAPQSSTVDSDLQRTPTLQQRHLRKSTPQDDSESPLPRSRQMHGSSSPSPHHKTSQGGSSSSPSPGRRQKGVAVHGSSGKTTPPSDLRFAKGQASPERYYSPMSGPVGGFMLPGAIISSPSQKSLAPSVADRSVYRGPSIVELVGMGKLPFVSSVDHTEGSYKFKPGKGIINFCKESPNFRDLLFCLLHGRPLALIGRPTDEHVIRRLIRVLWLFVPGHSSQQQIVTWQTTPLEIQDLSRVKLIGLCYHTCYPLGSQIKKYVSYWDCISGRLYTPPYNNGELLKPIVSRTKDRKTEEVFLIHTHSVLLDIAMKAFVYYHGYCVATNSQLRRQPSTSEASPKKFHTVDPVKKTRTQFLQMLGVKGSDADIIEYFIEVIRAQQLSTKHLYNGNPQDDDPGPVPLFLYTKQCAESYSKPKRPF